MRFTDLRLFAKARETYALPEELRDVRQFASVERLLAELDDVVAWLGREISVG